jgi:hypothetical protein
MNFLGRFSKDPQIPNFMKIYRVGAELFHADRATDREMDGQKDMTKLTLAFRNFANTRKNQGIYAMYFK